jgi:myo-inositol 2-dehydrogenase/D-chiro-inositol 1-dehydrogenase
LSKENTVTIKIGVIGTGNMGADHVNTLHRSVSGATVTMVTDADLDRAREVAAAVPGARVARSAAELIGQPEVDAIVIASPDNTHAELAIAAIRAGKAVMCEKPLATTLDECRHVVGAEDKAVAAGQRRLISMGFMRRFDPGYVRLKASVDARAHGAPLLVHCTSRGVSAGPGATTELAIKGSAVHEFDIVPWLLSDPIAEVSWHAPCRSRSAGDLQDPQLLLLRTANDVLVTVETFLGAGYGYHITCEVVSERGTVALAYHDTVIDNGDSRCFSTHPADWRLRFADAYRLELQCWVDALAAGTGPMLATARDGLEAAAVAEAAIASTKTGGMPVAVQVPEQMP